MTRHLTYRLMGLEPMSIPMRITRSTIVLHTDVIVILSEYEYIATPPDCLRNKRRTLNLYAVILGSQLYGAITKFLWSNASTLLYPSVHTVNHCSTQLRCVHRL